ncbi:ATP-binding protein [Serratia fonticola]|uniref:ATP-binding protein n=1 Tax=Serratia fonticola TaxID=47917 RepID=UPI0034C5E627
MMAKSEQLMLAGADCGQIRLAELSVYNWGSFHQLHTAVIDPLGTLVTGDNGSGKSTLIDGLMALLLPAGKASFNIAAAQGDRTDRSLVSYMRGSFGSEHDGAKTRVKSKREGPVLTALRALYRADDGSCIVLAALFWTTKHSHALADISRIYLVARRDVALKELLDRFGEGNVRGLNQWLKDDPAITPCGDNFSDYQETYRRCLHMENKNAPALLARALGLKKIDDLTELIRELVLEASGVKDDARRVVDEFADLVAIHERLLDARNQRDHLIRFPDLDRSLRSSEAEIKRLTAQLDALPVYMGECGFRLWDSRIKGLQNQLDALALEIRQLDRDEQETQEQVEKTHTDYINAGGDRIEIIKQELAQAQRQLESVGVKASEYQQEVKALGLETSLREGVFLHNQAISREKLQTISDEKRAAQDGFGALSAELANLQGQLRQLEQELEGIRARPDSNIDLRFQRLRDEMVAALALPREQCLFIGELLDVDPDQQHWQGAIERALGGIRTTLAVPEASFHLVTRWLNQRHTGLHVRVQVVREAVASAQPAFHHDGYLHKLTWREHPYRSWLQHHLARFDLHCVDTVETLDATAFSMTQQGLIHRDQGRFEKKDQHKVDDRRAWQLGFSNQTRIALLEQDIKSSGSELSKTQKALESARIDLDEVNQREALWQKLPRYRWEDIDAPLWQGKVGRIEQQLNQWVASGSDLQQCKARWEEAKQRLATLRGEKDRKNASQGGLDNEKANAQREQDKASKAAEPGMEDEVRLLLQQRVGALDDAELSQLAFLAESHRKRLVTAQDKASDRKNTALREAVGSMSSFRTKWEIIAGSWGAGVDSLPEYLQHLEQLEREGLPALVEQFKARLNKHATQSMVRIRQRIDAERDDILERIATINKVLARTEFRAGSYLKLGTKTELYPHVQDFNRQLDKVFAQATSDDHLARYQQLRLVVGILEKASNPVSSGTQESLRLLDARYQMSFFAEERDMANHEVRDVLLSSGGKSGGEKESFAGTIVAASLAYVLTPEGQDRPVYCTVFLDEAFSNTAEAVSRRVLQVFRELHIHVNIITPYKNLNLARESARSLLIAERDAKNHESRLCEVTWAEIDRRLDTARQRRAQNLGIELTEVGQHGG